MTRLVETDRKSTVTHMTIWSDLYDYLYKSFCFHINLSAHVSQVIICPFK